MSELERLHAELLSALQDASFELTRPKKLEQSAWLDITIPAGTVAVEWSAARGFGISLLPDPKMDPLAGLFEGPDVVVRSLAEARVRILELLQEVTAAAEPSLQPASAFC